MLPHFLDAIEEVSRRLEADPDLGEHDRRVDVLMAGALTHLRTRPGYMRFLRAHAEDVLRVASEPRRAGEALL